MKKMILIIIVFANAVLNAGWDKTYGGENNDYGNAIRQTPDGGFIIASASASWGSIDARMTKAWLMKLDREGELEWGAVIGDNDLKSGLLTLELTPDDGIIVGGFRQIRSGNFPIDRKWLLKYDRGGTKLWDSIYIEKVIGSINAIEITPDEGYLIAGTGEYNIAKTNKFGTNELTHKFGWVIRDILPAENNSYVLVGEEIGIPQDYGYIPSPFMIKIDADTNVVIDNPYGESDLGRFMAAAATSDGGYVLIGEKIEKEGDEPQIGRLVVTKFDQAGNLIWEHLGSDFSGGVDVALHDEDIYITGNVNGIENTLDYYVAKLNSQGILKWDTTFGGSDYDYPSELILDKTGNIFIIGQTASKGAGRYDLNFIKIDAPADPTSVENNKIESTEVYNYPNPFSSSTTVTVYCEDVNPETIKMYLYTSSGRLTCTYTGFSGTGGAYSRTINANELAPGVYYYKVLTGNSEFRGRMIHQR